LIILLSGTTASGKSDLSIRLAEDLNGVVINADAIQVYKGLSILTDSPDSIDLRRVPHKLYNYVDGCDDYSVARWIQDVELEISEACDSNLMPIITGGTGLYFRLLETGIAKIPAIPESIRCDAHNLINSRGLESVVALLKEEDPATAQLIDCCNPMRVIRAWEVLKATGIGLAKWWDTPQYSVLRNRKFISFTLNTTSKMMLEMRIKSRAYDMISRGVLDEVANFMRLYSYEVPASKAIGYKDIVDCIKGDITQQEACDRLYCSTRAYARRQYKWFKKYMSSWIWVDGIEIDAVYDSIIKRIKDTCY